MRGVCQCVWQRSISSKQRIADAYFKLEKTETIVAFLWRRPAWNLMSAATTTTRRHSTGDIYQTHCTLYNNGYNYYRFAEKRYRAVIAKWPDETYKMLSGKVTKAIPGGDRYASTVDTVRPKEGSSSTCTGGRHAVAAGFFERVKSYRYGMAERWNERNSRNGQTL